MKRLLLFLSLLPITVNAQKFELGVNYGNAFDATISIKLFHHLKAGLGYEYAKFTSTDIFGSNRVETKMNIPYCFIEYYNAHKKHEFYCGIDVGRMYLMYFSVPMYLPAPTYMRGYEYGTHAGYSRKIIKGLAANVQIGIFYYQAKTANNSFSGTTNGYGVFEPITIGLHYVINTVRKKTK